MHLAAHIDDNLDAKVWTVVHDFSRSLRGRP